MPVALKQNMPWAFGDDCVLYAPLTDKSAMSEEGWTVEGSPTPVDTPYGKALSFDGNDDAINLGTYPQIAGLSLCTLAFRVNVLTFDTLGADRIFDIGSSNTDRFGIIPTTSGGNQFAILNDITDANITIYAGTNLTTNTWYFFMICLGTGGMVSYLNGVPAGWNPTVLSFANIAGTKTIKIARYAFAAQYYANVIMKDLIIWRRRFTAGDALDFYNQVIGNKP